MIIEFKDFNRFYILIIYNIGDFIDFILDLIFRNLDIIDLEIFI